MDLRYICGKSGQDRTVSIYHTNRSLGNFESLELLSNTIYSSDLRHGDYLLRAGAQNGYYEIGYMFIKIIAHSSNGRTPDSDSGYCGSNP